MPQSFVSKYESSERRLDFVEVFLITQALGIEFESFAKDFSQQMRTKQVPDGISGKNSSRKRQL